MKYIKVFEDILNDDTNDFEEKHRIIDDTTAIFAELDEYDIDFKIIRLILNDKETSIRLTISKYTGEPDPVYQGIFRFNYGVIKDRVDMYIDYLKNKWDAIDIDFEYTEMAPEYMVIGGDSGFKKMNKEPDDFEPVNFIKLYIKKKPKKKLNMIKRFIKKFEGFSMNKSECDRCGGPTDGITTMSMFNEDIICMKCKDLEKEDPDYERASNIERDQLRKGNTNFKGAFPNYKPLK